MTDERSSSGVPSKNGRPTMEAMHKKKDRDVRRPKKRSKIMHISVKKRRRDCVKEQIPVLWNWSCERVAIRRTTEN